MTRKVHDFYYQTGSRCPFPFVLSTPLSIAISGIHHPLDIGRLEIFEKHRMLVHRAHDGQSFEISQRFSNFQSRDHLFEVISEMTCIPGEDLICMTREGIQINDERFEHIQEEEEQALSSSVRRDIPTDLFIFNRQYLYIDDLETLVREFEEAVPLRPTVQEPNLQLPFTPKMLDALLEWSALFLQNMTEHDAHSEQYLSQTQIIDESIRAAFSNVRALAETNYASSFEIKTHCEKELNRMKDLLQGHDLTWKILYMVQLHPKLLPRPVSEGKKRLGDRINRRILEKMIRDCTDVYEKLADGWSAMRDKDDELAQNVNRWQLEVQSTNTEPGQETLRESKQALSRANEISIFLQQTCAPDEHGWPAAERLAKDENMIKAIEEAVGELILLDEVIRDSLRRLVADKNEMIPRGVDLLQIISELQSRFTEVESDLRKLQKGLDPKKMEFFQQISRFKGLLFCYGSTLIEIYRRTAFDRHFLGKSEAIAELMANHSENEKRRRSDFQRQSEHELPWKIDRELKKDEAPSLDMSTRPRDGSEPHLLIEQKDVEELFQMLDGIEASLGLQNESNPIAETKLHLHELFNEAKDFESEFIRLIEYSLLEGQDGDESEGASEQNGTRPRFAAHKVGKDRVDLDRELQDLKAEYGNRERTAAKAHDEEMQSVQAELSKIKLELRNVEHALDQERAQHQDTKKNLDAVKADADTESARRQNMQDELSRLRKEVEDARRAEKNAKVETAEEVDRVNELMTHLNDIQLELEEVRTARDDTSKRLDALMSKGTSFEDKLRIAQDQIEELTHQLSVAKAETRNVQNALNEAEIARDKALRSYRAEADGDRAILEESLRNREADLQEAEMLLKRRENESMEHTDSINNLQSQLTAADEAHEDLVRQYATAKEESLNAEMAKRQSERNLEAVVEKVRILMTKSILLSDALEKMPILSSGNSSKNGTRLAAETSDDIDENNDKARRDALTSFKNTTDSVSLDVLLHVLDWLTRSSPEDKAIEKIESQIVQCRKWIKAYKHINEKGRRQEIVLREKITFRHFTAGDLALFLPTRSTALPQQDGQDLNSTSRDTNAFSHVKPWAAFNINFPHFFLNFTGKPENEQLRDSLRTKEWIVARITKIESRTANSTIPSGNPFQLADGVKFHLLDVESWNSVNSNILPSIPRRKSTSTTVTMSDKGSQAPPSLRRWDSTPDAHVDAEVREALEDEGTRPNASEGTESIPVADPLKTQIEEDVLHSPQSKSPTNPEMHNPSQSALSLALKQRATSPESIRVRRSNVNSSDGKDQSNQTRRLSNITAGRLYGGIPAGSVPSSASTTASDKYMNRFGESPMPAFGKSRALNIAKKASGAFARQSGVSTSKEDPNIISEKAAEEIGSDAKIPESTLDPFSASPAPATPGESGGMNEYLLRRNNSVNREPSGLAKGNEKGKMKEDDSVEGEQTDPTKGGNLRVSSRASIRSTSSKLSALNIKSRPAAIASARIRAPSAPKPTIEIAQGLNSFGNAAQASDDGIGPSMSSFSGGSERTNSGFSAMIGGDSKFSIDSRSPSHKNIVSASSPVQNRRSIFGSGWTLGKRSGSQLFNNSTNGDQGSFDGQEEDLSATVTDATRSLRRLTSYGTKRKD